MAILGLNCVSTVLVVMQTRRRNHYMIRHLFKDPVEAFISGIIEPLQHIQFILLLGAFTVRMPGFLRPVLSCFAWSGLMDLHTLPSQFQYPGIQDGFYALNATHGMEEMAQVLGAEDLPHLWIIVAFNIFVVMLAISVIVSVTYWIRRSGFPSKRDALEFLSWNVLRVFHSYFLQPLAAISYRLTQTQNMTIVHIISAVCVMILLAAALCVTFRRMVVQQHAYRLLADVSTTDRFLDAQADRIFTSITYTGLIVTSITIGSLQASGIGQVMAIAILELAVTGSLLRWRGSHSLRSLVLAVTRFSVCLIGYFLDEIRLTSLAKARVAIALLSLHLACVTSVFVIRPSWDVFKALGWDKGAQEGPEDESHGSPESPKLFGIFELSRRPSRPLSRDTTLQQPPELSPIRLASRPNSSSASHDGRKLLNTSPSQLYDRRSLLQSSSADTTTRSWAKPGEATRHTH